VRHQVGTRPGSKWTYSVLNRCADSTAHGRRTGFRRLVGAGAPPQTASERKAAESPRRLISGGVLSAGNLAASCFNLDNGTVAEIEKPVDGES
jgi:hypothetical protein